MNELLESELRAALTARVDAVPADTAPRLRDRDYRPRVRSLRPPTAIGGVALAAAAIAAVLILELGSATPQAFAGWSATPTTPTAGQVSGAEAACRTELGATAGARGNSALSPVLTDTRGPFTFVIFASRDARASASCITGPRLITTSNSVQVGDGPGLSADQILLSSYYDTHGDDALAFAEGHAGSSVSAVTLVLSDGAKVQTSLANGWFVAWWPGDRGIATAEVTTPQGTRSQAIGVSWLPPCPAGARCSGASSTGGGPGQTLRTTRSGGQP